MKKIFAFVLATIMVLSLVPASAFAAITKADCSDGHKDPVKIGGQAATCQQSGYTIYKCNECGETYVADPVEKLEHNWVSDKQNSHKDVAASCLYGTIGYKYEVCGNKGCYESRIKVVHYNSVDAHSLTLVSGLGCEALWACKTCKAEGHKAPFEFEFDADGDGLISETEKYKTVALSDAPEHTWVFDKVTAEPSWGDGKFVDGLALYVCEVENCPAVKSVVIACPECECPASKLVLVKPAVAPTCTDDGTLAVYQCLDCSAFWFDSNADEDSEKLTETDLYKPEVDTDDINDDDKITAEDAVLEAEGHTEPAANKITQTGCVKSYTCTVCKQAVSEANHVSMNENKALAPNCIRYGITYYTCYACGYQETKVVPATGHSKKTYITVPSTCSVQGGKYLRCTKEDCPLIETTINGVTAKFVSVVETYALNPSAHSLINQMTGTSTANKATCTSPAINVWVCQNGCATYSASSVEYLPAKGHVWHTYVTLTNCKSGSGTFTTPWTKATFMYCTTCGEKEYDLATGAPVPTTTTNGWENADITAATTIETTFSSVEAMLEYHGVLAREWSWNDDDEVDEFVALADTQAHHWRKYSKETWLGTEGAFTYLPNASKEATCLEAGYTAYVCNDCGMPAYVTIKKKSHDKLGGTIPGTPATCNTPGVRESYICSVCDTVWAQKKKANGSSGFVVTKNDGQTTDLTIKPCGNYEDLEVITNCKGTKYYKCKNCNVIYSSVACTTKVNPSTVYDCAWKYLVTATPANCGEDGTIGVKYCNNCKKIYAYIVYEIEGEPVEELITPTSGGTKYNASGTRVFNIAAAEYNLTKDVTIQVPKNGKATYIFEQNVTSVAPVVVKKLNHTTVGGTEYDAIEVDTEHSSTAVLDHSEATFTRYQCELCDYEIIDQYAPAAAGHINADGQVLTVDCENANAVSDRVCVICYKATGDKEASTIATGHNWSNSSKGSTADCQNAGYSYQECTKCGAFKVSDVVTPADADTFHAGQKAMSALFDYMRPSDLASIKVKRVGTDADYAHEGAYYFECAVCGYDLTKLFEEDCPGVGVELTLTADAESYMPGSSIFVTVSLDSLKGVEVWGANFTVGYTPEEVKFVGATTVAAAGFTGTAYAPVVKEAILDNNNAVTGYHYVPTGEVNVAINNANGEFINAATEVIVLEFKVINTNTAVKTTNFVVGNLDDGTTLLTASIVGSNGKPVASMANDVAECMVDLTAFADLDGKNGTNMFDAFELYYLILNDGYSVVADIDANGVVNVDDLNMLYDYIIGKITLEDIIYAEEKEEEEDDRVYVYDDAGNLVYDSYCDFDGNGKIDGPAENAAISGRIDPALFWGIN